MVMDEKAILLSEIRSHFECMKRTSMYTFIRWGKKGIRVRGGVVRLECAKVGRTIYTSVEAVRRFIAAQNEVQEQSAQSITPGQRARQSSAARHELEAMGI